MFVFFLQCSIVSDSAVTLGTILCVYTIFKVAHSKIHVLCFGYLHNGTKKNVLTILRRYHNTMCMF